MKILILTNHQLGLYKFRRELLERLVQEKYRVYVSVPKDEFTQELTDIGVKVIHNIYMDRRGTNPVHDLKLLDYYKVMIEKIRPDVVLSYTIKPNIYGGYICGKLKIPYIANVTGLGTSIQNGGLVQKLTLVMYKIGLRKAKRVFFQNNENKDFMLKHMIVNENKIDMLPGSGVNVEQQCYEIYPDDSKKVVFTTIGRIMKDKGIDEVLGAAEIIKGRHSETEFRLIGDFDEGYEDRVKSLVDRGIIKYLGFQKDIHPYMAESHAIIHASYHEGMSNILQEAASTGRPVIATDVPGCAETYDDGVTGIGFKAKSIKSLVNALEHFLSLSREERIAMGKAGRRKMECEFDRMVVVEKYMKEIKELEGAMRQDGSL